MAEPYIGEIRAVAFNYAPQYWAMCDGTLLDITQYATLYSLLGTRFGGDGRTTFALPDLRGRTIIGSGQGLGLIPRGLGQSGGQESITLTKSQMPSHTHKAEFTGTTKGEPALFEAETTVYAHNGKGDQDTPEGGYWAVGTEKKGGSTNDVKLGYSSVNTANTKMASDAVEVKIKNVGGNGIGITDGTVAIENTGDGTSIDIMQPYLTLNYIIALQGLYPPRH